MRDLWIDKKKRNLILLSSLVFLVITHAYRWMNAMYSHDSLLVVENDRAWQISIGRIFNPLYVWLRGYIVAPMNVAIFASVFLIISIALVVQILHLKKTTSIVICCGFLVTFETIVFVNAGFLHSMDLDMLALLFSVLAAYFFMEREEPLWHVAGVLSIAIMLGIFQTYIEVTILLICLSLLRGALEGKSPKKLFFKGLYSLSLLILGGVLYYICLRTVLNYTGIVPAANTSNGLVKMKTLTIRSALSLAKDAWVYTLQYLFSDSMIYHRTISRWVYRILEAFSLCTILWIARKKRIGIGASVLVVFLLLIMPLGGNCVYVLSLGFRHSLMNYSFVFFSILFVMVYDLLKTDGQTVCYVRITIPLLCAVLLLNHILFANQWYIRNDLYSRAGMSFMTRLVSDMEEVEGYEVGKTPVLILGYVDETPASFLNKDFEIAYDPFVGTTHHLAVSYYGTYNNFFRNILGYSINLIPLWEVAKYLDNPVYRSMPIYPEHGSIQLIEGVLVVRLSEDIRPEEFR